MASDMPVWTVVLALVGLLINLVIGLVAWAINTKLADLRLTITQLTAADQALGNDLRGLAKDLSDHKLYAANNYARTSDVAAIFGRIDALRGELIAEIKELVERVHDRIDYHHPRPKD